MSTTDDKVMRSFDTGATRDTAEGKLDMEGFTHPMVMKQFAKYMNMNRLQSDGQLRDSDNWQKGIPMDAYMKSLRRHHDELWLAHRGFPQDAGQIAALCGIMFNSMGMLHEILKSVDWKLQDFDDTMPTPEMKGRQDALRRKGVMNAKGQLLLPQCTEDKCRSCGNEQACKVTVEYSNDRWVGRVDAVTEEPVKSFCGREEQSDKCINCTPQCDYNMVEPDPKPFQMDKTGFCMCEFNASCVDCLCIVDCGNMIVDSNTERWDEHNEKLEDTPEVPICFGWCGVEHCIDCPDKPECDATAECHDCDVRTECARDWGRAAVAAREEADVTTAKPSVAVIHTFEPPALVFKNSGCNGCMSRMKSYRAFPCHDCTRNAANKVPGACGNHDYFSHQDEC